MSYEVSASRRMVLFGAEADKTAPVKHHRQGITRCHQHVHPQVELKPVDEEGVRDVALRDRGFLRAEKRPCLVAAQRETGEGGSDTKTRARNQALGLFPLYSIILKPAHIQLLIIIFFKQSPVHPSIPN